MSVGPVLTGVMASVVMVVAGASLAGCSSNDAKPTATPASSTPTLAGKSVPTDLSAFVCRRDKSGTWTATGTVRNAQQRSYSYEVSVLVSDSTSGTARTQRLDSIAPGGSTRFEITGIAASGASPQCRARVARLG